MKYCFVIFSAREVFQLLRVPSNFWRVMYFFGLSLSIGYSHATETPAQKAAGVATYRCSACHGPSGQSSNPIVPKLASQNAEYLARQISNFKTGARKGAVMFYQLSDLSPEDIAALADFFSRQRVLPEEAKDKVLDETGRKLYFGGNIAASVTACSTCHGSDAHGGGSMPRLAGQHAGYIAEQLYRFVDADRVAGQTQRHSVATLLTFDEIRAVSHFLSGLP